MSTPDRREGGRTGNAPSSVRRSRGNAVRRHWLTGAFVIGLVGLLSVTGLQVYLADQRLAEVQATRAQVEVELRELQQKNARLLDTLGRVTSDESMELKAKQLGFTRKNEKVYQTGPSGTP